MIKPMIIYRPEVIAGLDAGLVDHLQLVVAQLTHRRNLLDQAIASSLPLVPMLGEMI